MAAAAVVEGLKPFALLGGLDASELWPTTTGLVAPSWLLLAFAPRWRHTPALTLIGPLVHAAVYSLSVASPSLAFLAEADMTTLEGVVALFRDPNAAFAGWIHYLAYDALVGRWMALDSIGRHDGGPAFHVCVMVPVLYVALMAGPMGWLLYVSVVRPFILPLAAAAPPAVGGGSKSKISPKLY